MANRPMANAPKMGLLDAVLEAWDRNNEVLLNLVRLVPERGLAVRAMDGSPSVAEMLSHIHHERMVSALEEIPESRAAVPEQEWDAEHDRVRIMERLQHSAQTVREAVRGRIDRNRMTDLNFDHPVQLIHFLIFHEGYHHGQIKLALKASGSPIPDHEAGPLTWHVWRRRSPARAPVDDPRTSGAG